MTEEEAKQKWCPFANVYIAYGNTGAGGNRGLGNSREMQDWKGNVLCIGSACMAWRQKHPRVEREDHSGARDVMIAEAVRTGRTMQRTGLAGSLGILYLDAVGYCGIAGKP